MSGIPPQVFFFSPQTPQIPQTHPFRELPIYRRQQIILTVWGFDRSPTAHTHKHTHSHTHRKWEASDPECFDVSLSHFGWLLTGLLKHSLRCPLIVTPHLKDLDQAGEHKPGEKKEGRGQDENVGKNEENGGHEENEWRSSRNWVDFCGWCCRMISDKVGAMYEERKMDKWVKTWQRWLAFYHQSKKHVDIFLIYPYIYI